MRPVFWSVLGAVLACTVPVLAQDSAVDPAELKHLMAEHPAWAVWLSDPKLAQLTLA